MNAYMSETYDGNLLGLWKPLSSIYDGKTELKSKQILIFQIRNLMDSSISGWMEMDGNVKS